MDSERSGRIVQNGALRVERLFIRQSVFHRDATQIIVIQQTSLL